MTGGTDQTFGRTDSAGARYPLTDALGSVLALTDAAGAVQTSYSYEPFGKTTVSGATNSNSQQFTGRENDGQLYYYRNRFLHPTFGRFLSQDPAGCLGSGTDLYVYAFDDPVDFADPFGTDPQGGDAGGPSPGPEPWSEECQDLYAKMSYQIEGIVQKFWKIINDRDLWNLQVGHWYPTGNDPHGTIVGHQAAVRVRIERYDQMAKRWTSRCPGSPPALDPMYRDVPEPLPYQPPGPGVDPSKFVGPFGLTGAALILYLLLSEGTRAFPPRNLVPVF